ncbi:MAG: efflux RND transporter periplasmic adaptor subunit [Candidatus Eisenbacteria bacterium]
MLAERSPAPVHAARFGTALLALALAAGCGGGKHEASADAPAVAVQLVRVGSGAPGTLELPARVKAAEEATLTARHGGRISAFPVREGQHVAEGELLVRFDAPEARLALAAARADEQAARVTALYAQKQHTRMESLFAAGVVAMAERENAEAADRGAVARLAQATAARESAESAFEVRAPFAGVLVRRHADVGADVQPGSPLVDLRSPSGAEIVTAVPEAAASALAKADAWVQVGDGPWRAARLLRADGMVDPATRTRTARYAPRDRGAIEPGAYARVRLSIARGTPSGGALAVPTTSVVRRGALTGVYVHEHGRVWLRWLRLGRTQGDAVEVLSGLNAGEQVVAAPQNLEDGVRVKVGS